MASGDKFTKGRYDHMYIVYYHDTGEIVLFQTWEETSEAIRGRPNSQKRVKTKQEAQAWLEKTIERVNRIKSMKSRRHGSYRWVMV